MPSFTMTLEEVIEMEGESNIGLSDYPIFDEIHRPILNKKIIDQYYNQEIGQENISMFRLAMKRKMNLLMPLYNQHYELSKIELDALTTVAMSTSTANESVTEGTTTNSTVSKSNAVSRAVASSFPQNSLQEDSDYATGAQDNTSESTADGTGTEDQNARQTGDTKTTMSGFQGHQPELIFAARQTIVNIDQEIVAALHTLFMGIWTTDEEYTRERTHYNAFRF